MKKVVILVILDGWGIGQLNESNPIYMANPKNMIYLQTSFPCAALQASGIAVGLPWEEEGNSEVGHLTIGAGKIIYQHFPRISMAVEDGTFFTNNAIKEAFDHAKRNGKAVHLAGLLSDGNVHASFKHLVALLEMAKREGCKNLFIHIFTDGRDSAPKSALDLIGRIGEKIKEQGVGSIAAVMGRYYAMDRDGHWDRTEKAYQALIGKAINVKSPDSLINAAYEKGLNDEFIPPATVGETHPVSDGDSLIFFNFREDRMRQITEAFLNPQFDKFPTKKITDLKIITFTQYDSKTPATIAFPNEKIVNPLGKVLADQGKIQLRVAETQKYAHITYFFNGLEEKPFPNEYRILIPSQKIVHEDERPEMMATQITDRALVALNEGGFDFILINYANPDIIAHTGNYDATLKAIKVIDEQIGRLLKTVFEGDHTLIITSDHGNAEVLIDLKTGEAETKHDASPVPIYLVNRKWASKTPKNILSQLPTVGLLSDVAPTILDIMGLPKPKEMTGESLLGQLL
jgi:2,3-bisphosphoglycerate-independent phosphoglycerate mutase